MSFKLSKILFDEKYTVIDDKELANDKDSIIENVKSFEFIFINDEKKISLVLKNNYEKLIYDDKNNYNSSYKANLKKSSNPFKIKVYNTRVSHNAWKIIFIAMIGYIYDKNQIEIYGIEMTKDINNIICFCIYSKKDPREFIILLKKYIFDNNDATIRYFNKKKIHYI